ncbi:ImmA/IrrE family metallo-endopeptidase [Vagococcus vulneris]|uniref:ImmA/IrrE family metallo-endopeptidase n=1 Tax=Vagococcus vulneris TaxID=1977869 RepID=UPI00140309EA|nr:ImmA/IrrE family metallo-endopeptidase [Vagococcus vulneris]
MKNVIDELNVRGIKVIFLELDKHGYCVPQRNIIIINQNLNETDQLKVLFHELGHFNHIDYIELYKHTIYHSKMENEAECYAIQSLLEHHMLINDLEPGRVNYINFLESYNLDLKYAYVVKRILKDKITGRNSLFTKQSICFY